MKMHSIAAISLLAITVALAACDSGSIPTSGSTATTAATQGTSATAAPATTATNPAVGTATTETPAAGETPTTGSAGTGGTPAGGSINYPGGSATLTGAGSTFINPLMSQWSKEYNKAYSGVKVNYQSIGSGGGRQQFIAKTVDFGASDAPLTDDQFAQAGGPSKAMHIPVTMGGVVLTYNLPNVSTQLKLDGATVADIYLLNITTWNDPAIAALNPGVTLPNTPIAVVHRSDGSGTTDIFTDYLSKVSPAWAAGPKRGTSVQWPGGIGAQGNEGVTNQVKLTQGSIGYIELAYAKQNKLPYALMKNKAGNFVDATPANVAEAADSVVSGSVPADLRYSITDALGANAYPISGTTWILVYADQTDAAKGKVLAYFLWWTTHDGQQFSQALDYAALPQSLVQRDEAQIKQMVCSGSPCLP